MFSWFTSPALNAETTAPSTHEGCTADASATLSSVAEGFHPIELPPSPTAHRTPAAPAQPTATAPRTTSAEGAAPALSTVVGADRHDAPPASDLFGGLDLTARAVRRRTRARRSPGSASPAVDTSASLEAGDGPAADAPATDELTIRSDRPVGPTTPSLPSSAFAFLPGSPDADTQALGALLKEHPNSVTAVPSACDGSTEAKQECMRARLVRFYREHNPAKLPDVDATIARFAAREEELFAALVKKYGPEPQVLQDSALARVRTTDATTDNATANRTGAGSRSPSNMSAFAFVHGGGGEPTVAAVPASLEASSTHPTDNLQDRAGGPPAPSSRHDPSDGAATLLDKNLRQQLDVDRAEGGSSRPEAADEVQTPAAAETHLPCFATQRRDAEELVASTRARLTAAVGDVATLVKARRDLATAARNLEAEMYAHVQKERYAEAEIANQKFAACTLNISETDAAVAERLTRLGILKDELENHVHHLATLLASHGATLLRDSAREAVRLRGALDAVTSKLEAAQRMQEEIQDASQEERSVCAAEADRLAQEKTELEARRHAATKDVRAETEKVSQEARAMDDAIEELEARLASLREERRRKQSQLDSLTASLTSIEGAYQRSVDQIIKASAEVDQRSASIARDLQEKRRRALDVQLALVQQRDSVESQLASVDTLESSASAMHSEAQYLQDRAVGELTAAISFLTDCLDRRRDGSTLALLTASQSAVKTSAEEGLENADADLLALAARERTATASLQTLRARIPILENAKLAAVAAKQFRIAQQNAEELKETQCSVKDCEEELRCVMADLEQARRRKASLSLTVEDQLRQRRATNSARLQEYSEIVEQARMHYNTCFTAEGDAAVGSGRLNALTDAGLSAAFAAAWSALSEEAQDTRQYLRRSTGNCVEDSDTTPSRSGIVEARPTSVLHESRAKELESALAEALEREDFVACEALQAQIDALESPSIEPSERLMDSEADMAKRSSV